jgi:hypothetical protein
MRSAIAACPASPCKSLYQSLINRARVDRWNRDAGGDRCFMSAEDLTTQAGLAVQQDLALVALLGITHVERNGHHYTDGMAGLPEAEQQAFPERASRPLHPFERRHPAAHRERSARDRLAFVRRIRIGGAAHMGHDVGDAGARPESSGPASRIHFLKEEKWHSSDLASS